MRPGVLLLAAVAVILLIGMMLPPPSAPARPAPETGPAPWEVSQVIEEAKRIAREAAE